MRGRTVKHKGTRDQRFGESRRPTTLKLEDALSEKSALESGPKTVARQVLLLLGKNQKAGVFSQGYSFLSIEY